LYEFLLIDAEIEINGVEDAIEGFAGETKADLRFGTKAFEDHWVEFDWDCEDRRRFGSIEKLERVSRLCSS